MGETLGVLVAGGAGVRLGAGVPKALATLGGMTLLERAARTLAQACDELVIVAPPSLALPLPQGVRARGGSPARRLDDRPGAPGPLAGLVSGFLDRGSPALPALVLGVDFPFMEPAFLDALIERLGGDAQAVVPAPGGTLQPLAAAYTPAAAAILSARHAAGEGAPTRALTSLTVRRLDDAEIAAMPGGHACLINLNTPDDWTGAERRMAARATR